MLNSHLSIVKVNDKEHPMGAGGSAFVSLDAFLPLLPLSKKTFRIKFGQKFIKIRQKQIHQTLVMSICVRDYSTIDSIDPKKEWVLRKNHFSYLIVLATFLKV